MNIIKIIKKDIFWIIALVLLLVPIYYKLFKPGFFPMQDDLQAFRIYEMDKCIDDGQIPCRWVPDAGYQYGYPQFNYYPPSVYYIGALLHHVGIQYIDVVKILFILGYLVSALTMFLLVKSLWGNLAGFTSAILYSYVPYKAVEVYVRGALSEFWALAIFPVVFWAIYLFIKTAKKRYFIWLAVSVFLLLTTHNLMTLIFAPFALLWAVYWLYEEGRWKLWLKLALAGLLGVSLAAFFFLPVIFERGFVHIDSMLSGYFDYRQHFVSLYKLFLSREWGYGSSGFPKELLNLSTGLVQWLAGLIAVVLGIFNFKKHRKFSFLLLGLATCELFVLFMMHVKSSFIWARLPFLWWMQFPWRFLSVSIFLLAILGGMAVYLAKKAKYYLAGLMVLAAILVNVGFFIPKSWMAINDTDKFSGNSWEKQLTISIFDYLPIYATLPPVIKAPAIPAILDGKATITDYQKGSNWQTGNITVTQKATIRLPLFDFPGMKVWVNGQLITHNHNDCRKEEFCLGLIVFNLDKGNYIIEARLTDTPVRKIGNWLSLSGVIILVWLVVKKNEKISG